MTEVRETADGRGKGLYATKDFKRGEKIESYKGKRINRNELDRLYGKSNNVVAEYVVCVGENTFIDDSEKTGNAAFANDAVDLKRFTEMMNNGTPCNRAYSLCTDKTKRNASMTCYAGRAKLIAKRPIKKGEEILWSYGASFWSPES